MEEKQKGLYYGSASANPKDGTIKSNFVPEQILNASGYFQKSDVEFSRYKQDCRKRALDLASSQLHTPVLQKWLEENKFVNVDENTVTDKSPIMSDDLLMALADKYYNWLITIPNE